MKSFILLALALNIISFGSFAQNKCNISKHYEDFISIETSTHNNKEFLIKQVIETKQEYCFSNLVNRNISFIDYFLTNFTSNTNDNSILLIKDSASQSRAYFKELRNDSLFSSVMNELISKTIDKNIAKDSLSINQLLNIAVKYFSINRLTKNGHYSGRVCVGTNDIKNTEKIRKPFVEAFCFSSILKHYSSQKYNLSSEFINAIKELYTLNLGVKDEERLIRAQGAMYVLMKKNDKLVDMLKSEYESQKEYLPFILIY